MPYFTILFLALLTFLVMSTMVREFRKRHPKTEGTEPSFVREAIIEIAAWCQNTHQISTAVYRTAFALIWGGTLYLMWLAVSGMYVIEPGHTIEPVRGFGNDLGIALIYFGVPLSIAWLTWHGFTRLFVHSSHKELREQIETLEAMTDFDQRTVNQLEGDIVAAESFMTPQSRHDFRSQRDRQVVSDIEPAS